MIALLTLFVGCAAAKSSHTDNSHTNIGRSTDTGKAPEPSEEVENKDSIKLEGSKWELVTISGKMTEDIRVSLSFSDDKGISGKSGVNHYFGNYSINENIISIKVGGVTKMAGPEKAMKLEAEYLDLLEKVEKVEVNKDEMTLQSKDGNMLFKRVKEEK